MGNSSLRESQYARTNSSNNLDAKETRANLTKKEKK